MSSERQNKMLGALNQARMSPTQRSLIALYEQENVDDEEEKALILKRFGVYPETATRPLINVGAESDDEEESAEDAEDKKASAKAFLAEATLARTGDNLHWWSEAADVVDDIVAANPNNATRLVLQRQEPTEPYAIPAELEVMVTRLMNAETQEADQPLQARLASVREQRRAIAEENRALLTKLIVTAPDDPDNTPDGAPPKGPDGTPPPSPTPVDDKKEPSPQRSTEPSGWQALRDTGLTLPTLQFDSDSNTYSLPTTAPASGEPERALLQAFFDAILDWTNDAEVLQQAMRFGLRPDPALRLPAVSLSEEERAKLTQGRRDILEEAEQMHAADLLARQGTNLYWWGEASQTLPN